MPVRPWVARCRGLSPRLGAVFELSFASYLAASELSDAIDRAFAGDRHSCGHVVRVGARRFEVDSGPDMARIDLWTEAADASSTALELARQALETVAAEVFCRLAALEKQVLDRWQIRVDDPAGDENPTSRTVKEVMDELASRVREWPPRRRWSTEPMPALEFVNIPLPRELARQLPLDPGPALGICRDPASLRHVRKEGTRLVGGPVHGLIDIAIEWVQQQERRLLAFAKHLDARERAGSERLSWWLVAPAFLALTTVLAWIAALRPLWLTLFALSLTAEFAVVCIGRLKLPVSARPPRFIVNASAAFWLVSLFGVAFAGAALTDPTTLGSPTHLGEPFLASISLAVTAGVITAGGLSGSARVIAHVELLLFLTFVSGALVAVVRRLLRLQSGMDTVAELLRRPEHPEHEG
jgi:hypothetical protein